MKATPVPELAQQACPACLGDPRPPLCPLCADRGVIRALIHCAYCGRPIDPVDEAAYSCRSVDVEGELVSDHAAWHCADCHFDHPPPAPAQN